MPTLKTPPLETRGPGQTGRRVWKHPELQSHSALVLAADRLTLVPLAGEQETLPDIDVEPDADTLPRPGTVAVALADIDRLKLDLLTNSIAVDHRGGRSTIVFASPVAADACFTRVWRRMGDRFRLLPYKASAWELARTPLALLGALFAATAALAIVLGMFEDLGLAHGAGAVSLPAADDLVTTPRGPKSAAEVLLGWADWRVVCGLGGALAAVIQVWMYRRVTQPPVELELVRV
jgi:hypothetical protein